MVHTVLNINVIKTYYPYQDLESKIMLSSMIDSPQEFLTHLRRYNYSFTTQMVYGFRCPTIDDERLKILFQVNMQNQINLRRTRNADNVKTFHKWTDAVESVSSFVFDAFPILQKLPTFLTPIVKHAKKLHEVESENYMHHWLATKKRLQEGNNLVCYSTLLPYFIFSCATNIFISLVSQVMP